MSLNAPSWNPRDVRGGVVEGLVAVGCFAVVGAFTRSPWDVSLSEKRAKSKQEVCLGRFL